MGLTKQYLRYAPSGVFGVVAAKTCNSVYLQPNRFIASGGTHVVTLWDTRLQRKLRTLKCDSPAVILQPNQDSTLLAVGHQNGGLSIFDIKDKSEEASEDPNLTFEGHTRTVTCIAWDTTGFLIASGSKDTRIVIWDTVSETGKVKLTGHTAPISQVKFWKESEFLVSSSYDASIRIWDMDTYHCTHTIACNSQVRDFDIWMDCIIAAESHLRCFLLTEDTNRKSDWLMEELGTVLREGNDRGTSSVKVVNNRYLLTCGVKSPNIEIFHLSTPEEGAKRKRKRLKKNPAGETKYILRDLIRRWTIIKAAEGSIKSLDTIVEKENMKMLCGLPSNQVQVLTIPINIKDVSDPNEGATESTLGFDGHRKLVRAIAFSGDKTAILTASSDSFKLWNRNNLSCILTIPHEYPVVCCRFCPGDRHFIAGTTCGKVILGDVSLGILTQIEACGNENVWAIDVYSNNLGFAASNGNFIQFVDFSMSEGKLRFDVKRQLDVQDSVLSVKVSPNMKYLAAGLLDSTIKVFYLDTLKFHLSMYGHSLPVVAINISADGTLLVSCSGDKSVRVWGMDFGDCHCTLMHTEGLVGCSFIERTHHIVSVAKDSINFYDGDNHQRIQTVEAHVEGGATCMAVGGLFVATAGRDQTIRLFNRTQEILVLDDEREQERTAMLDKEAVHENAGSVTIATAETEKSADKLIEALDIFVAKEDTNPMVVATGAKDHKDFLLKTLTGVKASELEQSMLMLPFLHIHAMVPAISSILENYPFSTEVAIRCLSFLIRFHLSSFSAADKHELQKVAELAGKRVRELQETIGFNKSGLKFLYHRNAEKEEEEVFREMLGERKRKRKKKEKAIKRALLSV